MAAADRRADRSLLSEADSHTYHTRDHNPHGVPKRVMLMG